MRSLLRLLPYFARHKKKFYAGFLLVLGSTVAQVAMPVFVGRVVDSLKTGTSTPSSLATNALLIVGCSIASGFLFFLVRQTIIVASRLMEFDLRNDFLAHLERLSMRFFQNTPQGEVMAYATADFFSDRAQGVELRLGGKNSWRVWLNGKLLFAHDEYHTNTEIDQYVMPAQLQSGRNTILVKVCQNEEVKEWTEEWEFQLRVTDALGTPIVSTSQPRNADAGKPAGNQATNN